MAKTTTPKMTRLDPNFMLSPFTNLK